jgi:uncharacterized membrane protein YjjP (DUF1212 family)
LRGNAANHGWAALFAALAATVVTLMLNFYGGHDIQVLPAYFIGYLGIAMHELLGPHTNVFVVVTVVNFLLYFSIAELALAVKRKFC